MVLAAQRNEITERGRRRVVGALLTGAVLLAVYWAAWLLDRSLLASDTRPAYYEFEAAFAFGAIVAGERIGPEEKGAQPADADADLVGEPADLVHHPARGE